jgi:DNA (cytosine-5)-methyltransferase 1
LSKNILNDNPLYNHTTSSLSALDMEIISHVPPGGNWKNIPEYVPSKRLEQIRISFKEGKGSRSTYYGRLNSKKIAYTISTLFNRPGNGCYIHPQHNRLISQREAARLQSYPDDFKFLGSKTSIYKQIGNSVPVLLAKAVASQFPKTTFYDLFCGAGGMSKGFILAGHKSLGGIDIDQKSIETFKNNHSNSKNKIFCGDITNPEMQNNVIEGIGEIIGKKKLGLLIGGPPCQGFSTAGNHRSLKDPRNALPLTFLDLVSKLKPKNFVMEEVTGLLNMEQGIVLDKILEKASKMGYTCTNFVLHSEDYGVPQKRRRLFILGSSSGEKIEKPKIMFSETSLGLKKLVTVKDALSDLYTVHPTQDDIPLKYRKGKKLSEYQKWVKGIVNFKQFLKLQNSN